MTEIRDDTREEAERLGFPHLTGRRLALFEKARATAEGITRGLSHDLDMSDEPAHVFRAREEDPS